MNVSYPVLVTVALFFTLACLDIISRNYKNFAQHTIFGAIATLMMLYLATHDAEFVAWGLLILPILILIIGVVVGSLPKSGAAPAPVAAPAAPATPVDQPCYKCGAQECTCATKGASKSAPPLSTALPTQVSPPTTSCGPDSPSGKTQCLDTTKLPSA
jgi:hypothetical protein